MRHGPGFSLARRLLGLEARASVFHLTRRRDSEVPVAPVAQKLSRAQNRSVLKWSQDDVKNSEGGNYWLGLALANLRLPEFRL